MSNLTINGTNYAPINTGFASANGELVAGTYFIVPPVGESPLLSSPETEELLVSYVGVDGVGAKQAGYRGQNVTASLLVAGGSKTVTEGAIETLLSSMPTNTRFDVTMPGGSAIHGFKLIRGQGKAKKWLTIGSMVCALIDLELRSFSTSN